MSHPNYIFSTPSLNLATYLLVHGFELLGKERDSIDERRVVFIFQDQPNREKLGIDFLTGHGGMVDVHDFLEAQKRLKNLLREELLL